MDAQPTNYCNDSILRLYLCVLSLRETAMFTNVYNGRRLQYTQNVQKAERIHSHDIRLLRDELRKIYSVYKHIHIA